MVEGLRSYGPTYRNTFTTFYFLLPLELTSACLHGINAEKMLQKCCHWINPIALRKAKIVCNFGLSKCNRLNL